jgi:hypothetical protein
LKVPSFNRGTVEVRMGPRQWVTLQKRKSRRGKFYLDYLREIISELDKIGVPALMGNIRRLGVGRGPRLRAALEVLSAEKVSAAPPVETAKVEY